MGRELLRDHENSENYGQIVRFDSSGRRLLAAVDQEHAPLKCAWFPYFLDSYIYFRAATTTSAGAAPAIRYHHFGAVAFVFRLSRGPDAVSLASNVSYVHHGMGVSYAADHITT